MADEFKDIIGLASDCATIFAFVWAIYEFYYKRRFKIKATVSPFLINSKSTEYIFEFEVINLSEQSLKRIDEIGIWIRRWNSFGRFWKITLRDVGYQEKTCFTQDIFHFLDSAVKECVEQETFIDKMFKPRLKIVLKTTMERELEVKINEYHLENINEKITSLFHIYEDDKFDS